MAPNMSLSSVIAIVIASVDDKQRLYAKYYSSPHASTSGPASASSSSNPYPTVKEQKAFEKLLLEKTAKASGDVILLDNRIVLYKQEQDVLLYVIANPDENEILLFQALLGLRDSLAILLKNSTDKRSIVENMDRVVLAIDEVCDDGVILELDPVVIASRVTKAPEQDIPNLRNIDLSEQGIANMWDLGKKMFADRVRQGL